MKTILVPVDFSEVTDRVIDAAAALAERFESQVYLLHVADPPPDFVGYEPGPEYIRENAAAEYRKEHAALHELKGRFPEAEDRATALLIQGNAAEKIVEECGRLNADLIVIGSHGHGALYRILVGSVAETVLRQAPCPVLVIPARRT
jgi:nucleotide-binding universal stress UspA family protein